jgi:hypothetical protein
MGDSALQIALTFGHVLSAIGWLGLVLTMNVVIGPLMARFSPSTRSDLMIHFLPRFTRATVSFAGATVLSGFALYASLSPDVPNQQILGFGILLALIAFGLGLAFVVPLSRRLSQMATQAAGTGTPPPAEFAPTLRKVQMHAVLSMAILIVVVGVMVTVAGY